MAQFQQRFFGGKKEELEARIRGLGKPWVVATAPRTLGDMCSKKWDLVLPQFVCCRSERRSSSETSPASRLVVAIAITCILPPFSQWPGGAGRPTKYAVPGYNESYGSSVEGTFFRLLVRHRNYSFKTRANLLTKPTRAVARNSFQMADESVWERGRRLLSR